MLGVGFEGCLFHRREVERVGESSDYCGELTDGEQGRSAASKIDGGNPVTVTAGANLTAERLDIRVGHLPGGPGVESAIGAAVMAIWNMEVEDRRNGLLKYLNLLCVSWPFHIKGILRAN